MSLREAALVSSQPPGYTLPWSDKFDGTQLGQSKWMYWTGVKGESSERSENVSVESGNLVIMSLPDARITSIPSPSSTTFIPPGDTYVLC
jgi:hypothetical protein